MFQSISAANAQVQALTQSNSVSYLPLSGGNILGIINAVTLQQGAVNVNDLFQAKETALNPYITKTDLKGYITPDKIRIYSSNDCILYFTTGASNFIAVNPSTNVMRYNSVGNLHQFNQNVSVTGTIAISSSCSASSYVTVSDRRLKKNINDLSYGLDEILQLNSVSYHLLEEEEDKPLHIGFIAQDLKPIMPELVTEIGDYSGIQYTSLIPVLVNAIKELSSQVETLKALINNIK